uniref:CSON012308 protein n=1 Tax=Culicoides sonorensis TaxID=179676 RepID=A0A336M910_CULSO
MAPNISKFVNQNQNSILCAAGCVASLWILIYGRTNHKRKPLPEDQIQYCITEKKDKRQQKAHVNAEFFKQLRLLLGILIPRKWSVESGLLIAVAASLIARSISDIWMISNATVIESTIITMHRPGFRKALLRYFAALPAIAVVNNVLRWSIGELKLRFRTNLTKHLYNDYLK